MGDGAGKAADTMRDERKETQAARPRKRIVSPRGFVAVGCALVALFVVCELAGLREHVGCVVQGQTGGLMALAGAVYLAAYAGVVLVAPVLLLGGLLFFCALLVCVRGDRPDS